MPIDLAFTQLAQADPPDASKLPQDDIVGVTVLLLTCSYKDRVCLARMPRVLNPHHPCPEQ